MPSINSTLSYSAVANDDQSSTLNFQAGFISTFLQNIAQHHCLHEARDNVKKRHINSSTVRYRLSKFSTFSDENYANASTKILGGMR